MCGISGFVSPNYNNEHLIKMTNSLSHRGPDAKGYYFNEELQTGLGHRRLSIIDLTNKANQPMYSHCKRYVMVYNGEVYNYKAIAKTIGPINWKTSSDSEVILEAFAKWGVSFVNRLDGMFAIAIHDKLENKLFLFRDRMGIKPLFYCRDKNDLIFSSEIKAINQIKKEKKLNYDSVYSFLHLGYIPSNLTIYEKVFKVKPGSFIECHNNEINETFYWEPHSKIFSDTCNEFDTSKKKLKSLLENSIKNRLISDVPVGVFLSGGTDSSLISAIAQEVNPTSINTFSIGFEDSKYNESLHAKKVAKHLGTNHNEFILKEQDALNELESIMYNFDEPYADSSALPTLMVSKMAKNHVTVCLSGDGGDELFMGYGSYNWAKRLSNPLIWSCRKPIANILSRTKNNKYSRASLVFNAPKFNLKSHIFSQEQYLFSEIELSRLLSKGSNSMIIKLNNTKKSKRRFNSIEDQAFFDINNYLIDDLLVKIDRSSMFTSLEARVPMLDHKVVEFALNLNFNLKINNGTQKFILKQLLCDYIPSEIMQRPKWGFSIPLEKWLKKDLKFLVDKYLSEESINDTQLLEYGFVSRLVNKFKNGENYLYNRIWALIMLNRFLIKNNG